MYGMYRVGTRSPRATKAVTFLFSNPVRTKASMMAFRLSGRVVLAAFIPNDRDNRLSSSPVYLTFDPGSSANLTKSTFSSRVNRSICSGSLATIRGTPFDMSNLSDGMMSGTSTISFTSLSPDRSVGTYLGGDVTDLIGPVTGLAVSPTYSLGMMSDDITLVVKVAGMVQGPSVTVAVAFGGLPLGLAMVGVVPGVLFFDPFGRPLFAETGVPTGVRLMLGVVGGMTMGEAGGMIIRGLTSDVDLDES